VTVAATIALPQRPPGVQLLRAHPLPVIQVVHVAVEHRLPVGPEELRCQNLPPGKGRERVGLTHEPDPVVVEVLLFGELVVG